MHEIRKVSKVFIQERTKTAAIELFVEEEEEAGEETKGKERKDEEEEDDGDGDGAQEQERKVKVLEQEDLSHVLTCRPRGSCLAVPPSPQVHGNYCYYHLTWAN